MREFRTIFEYLRHITCSWKIYKRNTRNCIGARDYSNKAFDTAYIKRYYEYCKFTNSIFVNSLGEVYNQAQNRFSTADLFLFFHCLMKKNTTQYNTEHNTEYSLGRHSNMFIQKVK